MTSRAFVPDPQVEPDFTRLEERLQLALKARLVAWDSSQAGALRLFNGFYEGEPDLVVDLYAQTLLILDYAGPALIRTRFLDRVQNFYRGHLPWIKAVLRKNRSAPDANRLGQLTYGQELAQKICEHGVGYALDLTLQQDASFYLDTRLLRRWLLEHASGWKVLNTFAYTGSLGIAALAGGAEQVLQSDRSRKFLEFAHRSARLNRLDLGRMKLVPADFFSLVARLKREGEVFDCVILDPPFFSTTQKGSIHLGSQSTRLINKIRPLVRDGGLLVAINNALFLSGVDYYQDLQSLCQDGYLAIEELIPVPADITGYPHTIVGVPPVDPAPFNHATKIAVLRVRRK